MPALITAAALKALVPTALDDDTLTALIEREEAEMIRRFGPHSDGETAISETVTYAGADVFTTRPIDTLSSISVVSYAGASPVTLTTSQYYRIPSLNQIRLAALISPAYLTITYVPPDDRPLRTQVLIDLVRLAVEQFSAAGGKVSGYGFSIEASSASAADRGAQREQLYSRLTLQAV